MLIRVYMFVICIKHGIAQGLLQSTSFAFGTKRLKRLRNLALHSLWIGTAWDLLCCIIVVTCSRGISKIWLKDEKFLDLVEKFLSNCFVSIFLSMTKFTSITTLQACKKVVISIIQSIITLLIPIPLFSTILYLTDKDNPPRLLYAFVMTDCLSFIICFCVSLVALRFLCKKNPDLEIEKVYGKDENEMDDVDKEPSYLSDDSLDEKVDDNLKQIGSSISMNSATDDVDSPQEL